MSDKEEIEKQRKLLKEETEKEKLREEEEYKKLTDIERKKYFKGTIVVIVLYAVTILCMCVAGIASPTIRDILFVSGFPFTTAFISGVILVIILLVVQIFNYKPSNMPEKHAGDNLSCPDYWELKKTPSHILDTITDKKIRRLAKYHCVNTNGTSSINIPSKESATDDIAHEQLDIAKTDFNSNSIDADYHMKCNRLYPDYMASIDKKTFPLDPTKMRCKYIEACSRTVPIAWTNVCER